MPEAKEKSLLSFLKCKQAEMCRLHSTGRQQAKFKLRISELGTPQGLVGMRKASTSLRLPPTLVLAFKSKEMGYVWQPYKQHFASINSILCALSWSGFGAQQCPTPVLICPSSRGRGECPSRAQKRRALCSHQILTFLFGLGISGIQVHVCHTFDQDIM